MARRKDAEEDAASKAILDQLQTKTVGAPPSSTGLTGDQLPETVFSVADFDRVKNQITLQLSNLELLNVLNTIGQVTNKQSQSGPIAGGAKFVSVTVTDTNKATLFQPEPGEVWQLMGIGAVVSGGSGTRTFAAYIFDGTTELNWLSVSSSGGNLTFTGEGEYPDAPFFITNELYQRVQSTGTFDSVTYNMAVVRVR